jgi:chromosome segregation ATPase
MGGIQEKRVEIEVIREKRVEIPVEVIKEVVKVEYVEVPVEVIKEVQVEKVVIKEVVKEVPVETVVTKIEYISDKTGENELLLKIQQLESEKQEFSTKLTETEQKLQLFSTKTTEMENIFQDEKNELLLKMKQLENQPEKMITDNSKQKALEETIQKIRTELQLKNKEINDLKLTISDIQKQGGSKSVYMDGSNLGKILR